MNCLINLSQINDSMINKYSLLINEKSILDHLFSQVNCEKTNFYVMVKQSYKDKLVSYFSDDYSIVWIDSHELDCGPLNFNTMQIYIETLIKNYGLDEQQPWLYLNSQYLNFENEWVFDNITVNSTFIFNGIEYMAYFCEQKKFIEDVVNLNMNVTNVFDMFDIAKYEKKLFLNEDLNKSIYHALICEYKFEDALYCLQQKQLVSLKDQHKYLDELIKNLKFETLVNELDKSLPFYYGDGNELQNTLTSEFLDKYNKKNNLFEFELGKYKTVSIDVTDKEQISALIEEEKSVIFSNSSPLNVYVTIFLIITHKSDFANDEEFMQEFFDYIKRVPIDMLSKKIIFTKIYMIYKDNNHVTNKLISILMVDYKYFSQGISLILNNRKVQEVKNTAYVSHGNFDFSVDKWFENLKDNTKAKKKINYIISYHDHVEEFSVDDEMSEVLDTTLPEVLNISSNFEELFPNSYKKITHPYNLESINEDIGSMIDGVYNILIKIDKNKYLSKYKNKKLLNMIEIYLAAKRILKDNEEKKLDISNIVFLRSDYLLTTPINNFENFNVDNIVLSDFGGNVLMDKGVSVCTIDTLKKYTSILKKFIKTSNLNDQSLDDFEYELNKVGVYCCQDSTGLLSKRAPLVNKINFANELKEDKLANPSEAYVNLLESIIEKNYVNKVFLTNKMIESIDISRTKLETHGFTIRFLIKGDIVNYFDQISMRMQLSSRSSNNQYVEEKTYFHNCNVTLLEEGILVEKYFGDLAIQTAPSWELRINISSLNELKYNVKVDKVDIINSLSYITKKVYCKETVILEISSN